VIQPGKRIFIDDGLISVKALEIGSDYVIGEVENGGNLGSRKGCNLPATDTDLPAVSPKDISDLQVKHFVRKRNICFNVFCSSSS
jgi:pyruvate kinase